MSSRWPLGLWTHHQCGASALYYVKPHCVAAVVDCAVGEEEQRERPIAAAADDPRALSCLREGRAQ